MSTSNGLDRGSTDPNCSFASAVLSILEDIRLTSGYFKSVCSTGVNRALLHSTEQTVSWSTLI
jgi:hypothetical protein